MKKLFLGIIMLMMMSFAHANDIYVTQSGATLDLDITQDGQDNQVGNSTTSSSVVLVQHLLLILTKLVVPTY